MTDWDYNVYYSPEKHGVTAVGEIEWSEPNYSFDLTVLWKAEDGTLYWGDDSGCSCPSPFEDISTLAKLSTGTKFDFIKHVNDLLSNVREYAKTNTWARVDADHAEGQVAQLLEKVATL